MQLAVTCDQKLEPSILRSYGNGAIKTRLMRSRRGIFRDDSLSPLLFCMAHNHLRVELRKTGYRYWMRTGRGKTTKRQLVSNLLYTDDLKLYGRYLDQLKGLLYKAVRLPITCR